ncbi:MAG: hypothetical protein ABEH47_07700 [Haloferacaceae archaeon]
MSPMERFARLVVAGGVALVAGLRLRDLATAGSGAWVAGTALALVGGAVLLVGIGVELDV